MTSPYGLPNNPYGMFATLPADVIITILCSPQLKLSDALHVSQCNHSLYTKSWQGKDLYLRLASTRLSQHDTSMQKFRNMSLYSLGKEIKKYEASWNYYEQSICIGEAMREGYEIYMSDTFRYVMRSIVVTAVSKVYRQYYQYRGTFLNSGVMPTLRRDMFEDLCRFCQDDNLSLLMHIAICSRFDDFFNEHYQTITNRASVLDFMMTAIAAQRIDLLHRLPPIAITECEFRCRCLYYISSIGQREMFDYILNLYPPDQNEITNAIIGCYSTDNLEMLKYVIRRLPEGSYQLGNYVYYIPAGTWNIARYLYPQVNDRAFKRSCIKQAAETNRIDLIQEFLPMPRPDRDLAVHVFVNTTDEPILDYIIPYLTKRCNISIWSECLYISAARNHEDYFELFLNLVSSKEGLLNSAVSRTIKRYVTQSQVNMTILRRLLEHKLIPRVYRQLFHAAVARDQTLVILELLDNYRMHITDADIEKAFLQAAHNDIVKSCEALLRYISDKKILDKAVLVNNRNKRANVTKLINRCYPRGQ